MKSAPTEYTLRNLVAMVTDPKAPLSSRDGETWFPARPLGFYSIGNRFRCAWLAFTGRADVVRWPQEQ